MTEENNCYYNAIAVRVNSILKDEFYLYQCFFSLNHAVRATKNAIEVDNSKKNHISLEYRTSNMVFNAAKIII